MRDDATRIAKRFIGEFQRDDIAGLSAELAYRFLFAVFPFGIFVAALTAFIAHAVGFADPTSQIMGSIGDNLPSQIADGIRPQLQAVLGSTAPGLLTFGAIAALWAATGGMNALMKALNRAWEVEETRGFIPKTAMAIGLTLLGSVGLIGSFVTIVGASLLTTQLAAQLGADQTLASVLSLLRWPLVFVMLSLAVGILYHYAPNFRAPWRWCIAGGAVFAIAWIVATAVFGLYVANFANYANTYGALGGVIVLMLWFYLSGILVVSAAALAAAALKELQPAAVHRERVARGAAGGEAIPGSRAPSGDRSREARVGEGARVGLGTPVGVGPAGAAASGAIASTTGRAVEAKSPAVTARPRPRDRAGSDLPVSLAVSGAVIAVGVAAGTLAGRLLARDGR